MNSKTNHRKVKHVEHVLDTKERRNERKIKTKLRQASPDDDWDDDYIPLKAHTFKRRQEID